MYICSLNFIFSILDGAETSSPLPNVTVTGNHSRYSLSPVVVGIVVTVIVAVLVICICLLVTRYKKGPCTPTSSGSASPESSSNTLKQNGEVGHQLRDLSNMEKGEQPAENGHAHRPEQQPLLHGERLSVSMRSPM